MKIEERRNAGHAAHRQPRSPTALGFGGAAIGNLYRPVSDEAAAAAVTEAWNHGVRYFDTAPHYGFGLGEERLGAALKQLDPRGDEYRSARSTAFGRRLRRRGAGE